MNFPKYEQSFIQEMKRLNYSGETIKNYVSCLRMFFNYFQKKEHPLHINEAEKAGIKKRVWTHLMRHCSFTHMVEAGTDINLVQRLAGHSSVKTTSIYLHTSHNLISKIQSPISAIQI